MVIVFPVFVIVVTVGNFWFRKASLSMLGVCVWLSLPVVQSSRNIAKIIKITEKKGFRSLIGVNIENSAKNVIKLANFKAYSD